MRTEIEPLLLTHPEAAAALHVSERTLSELTRERKIAVVKIRGSVRYSRADLQAYIDRQRVAAESSGDPITNTR